jgi:putative ABC transport system substrate-binding protein
MRWSIGLLIGLAVMAAPLTGEAQQGGAPRIGWLTSSVVHTRNVDAFRRGMRDLGHRDVNLEIRAAAGDVDRLPGLAADLVALNVEVIVTDGGPALFAARRATTTIPIVIGAAATDLVRQGVVPSLARPGGNITGFVISTGVEIDGKRLELLREAIPALTRVALVLNPRNQVSLLTRPSIEAAAQALSIQLDVVEASDAEQLERALTAKGRGRVDGLLTTADAYLWSLRDRVVAISARHRLPAVYPEVEFVEAGGLMAYGPNVPDNFRRAAGYVDKVLKGVKPGDLPIEQPAKFDFAINLKAAKALGLTIPPSLLLRADQVIE